MKSKYWFPFVDILFFPDTIQSYFRTFRPFFSVSNLYCARFIFLQKLISRRTWFLFFINVNSGTFWFVYLKKYGFRVINWWVFRVRGIGSLPSTRAMLVDILCLIGRTKKTRQHWKKTNQHWSVKSLYLGSRILLL